MAIKGIKFMGKNPIGKAKAINVDVDGNILAATINGESIDSVVLSALPHTQTYSMPTNVKKMCIINKSYYTPAYIVISGKRIRIEAGQYFKFSAKNITTLGYASVVGRVDLQLIFGDMDVDVSSTQRKSNCSIGRIGVITDQLNVNLEGLVAVKGWEMYRFVGYKLYYSNNLGVTWTLKKNFTSDGYYINKMFITYAGSIIASTSDRQILRSIDKGMTFVPVTINGSPLLSPGWLPIDGIDQKIDISNGDYDICFAEYTDTSTTPLKVYRSADDGVTWTEVFSKISPSEIRHWHSCQYNQHNGQWYITSGDSDTQTKWWTSADNGTTWTEVVGAGGSQLWRTLSIIFLPDGTAIWGADTTNKEMGMWKGTLSNLQDKKLIFPLDTAAWVCRNIGSNIVVGTQVEPQVQSKSIPALYVSHDFGNTWHKEVEWELADGVLASGFNKTFGMDVNGRIYFGTAEGLVGRSIAPDYVGGISIRF